MGPETKHCQNCKNGFTIEPDDFAFYERMKVPPPTFCPGCRLQRRLSFENGRYLYKRACTLCGKQMIALYDDKVDFPVYCMTCFESDQWDPLSYGRDYDFSRPFFRQVADLWRVVPRKALVGDYPTWTNSEYNNMAHSLKNCYLLFNSDYDENCMYGSEVERSQYCADVTMVDNCQFCYGSVGCIGSYQAVFSVDCESCHNVWFSRNLTGCSDCFGCVNLKNQKYHIFNKPYTKEEYEAKLKTFRTGSAAAVRQFREDADALALGYPRRYMHGSHNVNASGDYVYNSKNVRDSYIALEGQDCRYCMWLVIKGNKDCYDYTQFGQNAQDVYEAICCGLDVNTIRFSDNCVDSVSRVTYCSHCYVNSSDLFGCAGLKKKQYCILNKQYTKEEYESLVPRIIEHMNAMPYADKKGRRYGYGEFFPLELSVFAYNETQAQEFFPLSAAGAAENGYRWRAPEEKTHVSTLAPRDLPDDIADALDTITSEVILCKAWEDDPAEAVRHGCTKAFRIIPDELAFYRKMNLPLPRFCPNSRHHARMQLRNLPRYYRRRCMCGGGQSDKEKATGDKGVYTNTAPHLHGSDPCPNEFETSYAPERPEIVYCESCYQAEVS